MSAEAVRVGVDIGGTGTRFVAVRDTDRTVVRRHAVPTPRGRLSTGEAATFFRDAVTTLVGDRAVLGVGVGASGPVDRDGVIQNPHTLRAFSGIGLGPVLQGALGVRSVVGSDAVAAALAEWRVGAGVGAADLLHVTIGTGVGVAVLRDGVPLLGADGFPPESGHLDVPVEPAPPCYCGRARCWEQVASRGALQRLAGAADMAGIDRLAATASDRGAAGAEARGVFDRFGRAVGLGLRTLVTVLRPTRVVIGGGGARFFESYAPAVSAAVTEVELHGLSFDLRPTALDDWGGAIGAALLLDG